MHRTVALVLAIVSIATIQGAERGSGRTLQGGIYPPEPFDDRQIEYSITGAVLGAPRDELPVRRFDGRLTGRRLIVSGTAHATRGWRADLQVRLSAIGVAPVEFTATKNPWPRKLEDDPMHQAFELAIDIPDDTTRATFEINLSSYNTGFAEALSVRGNLEGPPATPVPQPFAVDHVIPPDGAAYVDWQEPVIGVAFSSPIDPDSVNDRTMAVGYIDAQGRMARVSGSITVTSGAEALFRASAPLLDGVRYFGQVCGKSDKPGASSVSFDASAGPDGRRHVGRAQEGSGAAGEGRLIECSAWVKGRDGGHLERGEFWGFSTAPRLEVSVVAVQAVENVDLVVGKATVIKVFTRWDRKPGVHPDAQLKTLDADVAIEWRDGTGATSPPANWSASAVWTPAYGTAMKREFRAQASPAACDASDCYSRAEKMRALDSVNYYGFVPRVKGSVTLTAKVTPKDQVGSDPESFESPPMSLTVREVKAFRYRVVPIDAGDWGATGRLVAGGGAVDLTRVVELNHNRFEAMYPYSPVSYAAAGILEHLPLVPIAGWGATEKAKADRWITVRLLHALNRWGRIVHSDEDAVVGVVPYDWMDIPAGASASEGYLGQDYYRHAIVIAHDTSSGSSGSVVMAHEFGHAINDWASHPGPATGDGFEVAARKDWRRSVNALDPHPADWSPIRNMMYFEVSRKWWIADWEYNDLLDPPWLDFHWPWPQLSGSRWTTTTALPDDDADAVLLVAGSIEGEDEIVTLDPWYVLTDGALSLVPPTGYTIELASSDGLVLGSYPLPVVGIVDGLLHFLARVPYQPGTSVVRIGHEGRTIHEVRPSAASPQLAITAPAGGEGLAGVRDIAWSAHDPDGDALRFAILHSADGGARWNLLALDESGSRYALDTRALPNGQGQLFKVLVTDGLNTTERTVGPLTVANGPRIVLRSPAVDEADVSLGTSVVATFGDLLDAETVGAETFRVEAHRSRRVPGALTYDADRRTVTFQPTDPLDPLTTYTVRATRGISGLDSMPLDADVVWTFTTEADQFPPRVTRVWPSDGSRSVDIDSELRIEFDEPVDPISVFDSRLVLVGGDGQAVSVAARASTDGWRVSFRPAARLRPGTSYFVALQPGIADVQGNATDSAFRWSFITGRGTTIHLPYLANREGLLPAPTAARTTAPPPPTAVRTRTATATARWTAKPQTTATPTPRPTDTAIAHTATPTVTVPASPTSTPPIASSPTATSPVASNTPPSSATPGPPSTPTPPFPLVGHEPSVPHRGLGIGSRRGR